MKNDGKKFEEWLVKSAKEQGWDTTRLRDAGFTGSIDTTSKKRFTIRNICDFIFFKSGKIFFIEAKHSKTKSITASRLSQLEELVRKASNGIDGLKCGFICKTTDAIFFVDAITLRDFFNTSPKKSFTLHDIHTALVIDTVIPVGKRTPRADVNTLLSDN